MYETQNYIFKAEDLEYVHIYFGSGILNNGSDAGGQLLTDPTGSGYNLDIFVTTEMLSVRYGTVENHEIL